MGVLDGHDGDVVILEDGPGTDVVTLEDVRDRHSSTAVGDPGLGADREVLDGCADKIFGSARAVHVDRTRSLAIPCERHQRAETRRVVVVVMRDEDGPDVPKVHVGTHQPT